MPIQFSADPVVYRNTTKPVNDHIADIANRMGDPGEIGDLAKLASEFDARMGNGDGVLSGDEFENFVPVLDSAMRSDSWGQSKVSLFSGRATMDLLQTRAALLNGTLDPTTVANNT